MDTDHRFTVSRINRFLGEFGHQDRPRNSEPFSCHRMSSAVRLGLGSASEVEASYTLEGGYATEALPDGTGAWLAHRAEVEKPGSGPGNLAVLQAQTPTTFKLEGPHPMTQEVRHRLQAVTGSRKPSAIRRTSWAQAWPMQPPFKFLMPG